MKYLISGWLLFLSWSCAAADVQASRDRDTGMWSWKIEEHGLSIELIQLLPDYVRALYAARGLPSDVVEGVAAYCVFGTIVKNTSDGRVGYKVSDWRYVTEDGKEHPLKTKSEWVAEWRQMGVRYSWSILPDDQILEVGDWSQGFTTVRIDGEGTFDLIFTWSIGGHEHAGRIDRMHCARDQGAH